jgi:very-short-patch-repair endonuclease
MEHRFAPPRRYRFDLAWPQESVKLAVEVDGGTWIPGGGRHNRPQGFENDIRKLNLGVMLGWRILRYTPAMIESGEARAELEKILGE